MRRATYQAYIGLRVPPGMPELVDAAAEKTMQNPASYIRQALIERLQRDGIAFDQAQRKTPPIEISGLGG
jgi:hypothetical protein